MWEDSSYCWVVLCKNKWFHLRQNLFNSHRIPLGEADAVMPMPSLDRHFRVQCDQCRKEYFYKPSDVRRFEQELPEGFTPHPLFRAEGERRRSKRAVMEVPVVVSGESVENQPFREETFATAPSENGALIALSVQVRPGQALLLTSPRSRTQLTAKVVRINPAGKGRSQVGIEFAEPAVGFWPAGTLVRKLLHKR